MKQIEKLRTILCEVEEVKKDLMELKVGCKFITDDFYKGIIERVTNISSGFSNNVFNVYFYEIEESDIVGGDYMEGFQITGNPIEERHLRMYCEKKGLGLGIDTTGVYQFLSKDLVSCEVKTNNTKTFNNQTEETIKKIVDFLEGNK